MIHSSRYFTYDNYSLSNFPDMRVAVDRSDMYEVNIIGNRQLLEEKIVGRPAPYFYGFEDQPLTLNFIVALERPKRVSELRPFFQWLYGVDGYRELVFDSDPNKRYYAMFVGEPVFYYIDQSKEADINANNRQLIGYIELTARCNSGSAFGTAVSIQKDSKTSDPAYNLVNNGDDVVLPSLKITTPQALTLSGTPVSTPFQVEIKNTSNATTFRLNNVEPEDIVTVDMSLRTISAEQTENIYSGWNREYLKLEIFGNLIQARLFDSAGQPVDNFLTIEYIYQPIRYL